MRRDVVNALFLLERSLLVALVEYRLTLGTIHGRCASSRPWCTDSAHYFSNCTLLKNVMHHKHKDRNNEEYTMNLLIPCSRWRPCNLSMDRWRQNPAHYSPGLGPQRLTSKPGNACQLPNRSEPFRTVPNRSEPRTVPEPHSHPHPHPPSTADL